MVGVKPCDKTRRPNYTLSTIEKVCQCIYPLVLSIPIPNPRIFAPDHQPPGRSIFNVSCSVDKLAFSSAESLRLAQYNICTSCYGVVGTQKRADVCVGERKPSDRSQKTEAGVEEKGVCLAIWIYKFSGRLADLYAGGNSVMELS